MLRPIVEQVARQTQEHVSVGTRDGDEIIHLVRSRYSHVTSLSIRPGSRVPMYCTASGRIWLAWMEEGERNAYFARHTLRALTPYTQTDRVQLDAQLLRVKEQGFCIVDQEYEMGMRVLGVPLLDRDGQLKATLTITTHASRLSVDEIRLRFLSTLYEAQALLRPVVG
jgi:IclR family pca regulon transcriptional regulator